MISKGVQTDKALLNSLLLDMLKKAHIEREQALKKAMNEPETSPTEDGNDSYEEVSSESRKTKRQTKTVKLARR